MRMIITYVMVAYIVLASTHIRTNVVLVWPNSPYTGLVPQTPHLPFAGRTCVSTSLYGCFGVSSCYCWWRVKISIEFYWFVALLSPHFSITHSHSSERAVNAFTACRLTVWHNGSLSVSLTSLLRSLARMHVHIHTYVVVDMFALLLLRAMWQQYLQPAVEAMTSLRLLLNFFGLFARILRRCANLKIEITIFGCLIWQSTKCARTRFQIKYLHMYTHLTVHTHYICRCKFVHVHMQTIILGCM